MRADTFLIKRIVNAKEIEISTNEDMDIVWRYLGEPDWKILVSNSLLFGAPEFQVQGSDLQWRQRDTGMQWVNLYDLTQLQGRSINVIKVPTSQWPPAPDADPMNFYVRVADPVNGG